MAYAEPRSPTGSPESSRQPDERSGSADQRDEGSTATLSQPLRPAFSTLGAIDDLTKYRIVEFLLRQSGGGNATTIARALGFHSVEWTNRALGDLAAAGVCSAEATVTGEWYRLSPSALTRGEIQRLRDSSPGDRAHADLIRSLAVGSLRRARTRFAGRPRG